MVYLMDFNREQRFDPVAILADGPYQVHDIGIISILQRASIDLAALCDEFGLAADARELRARVQTTQLAVPALWSARWQQHVSRDALTGELLEVPTSAGLLAAYAGFPADIAPTVAAWLQETPWVLPSTRSTCAGFEPLRYWRGPVWQHMNMLIATGLKEQGHSDLAATIRERSGQMLSTAGFHEYFDPLTGAGLGGRAFSWTAATYLHWVAPAGAPASPAAEHITLRQQAIERTTRPWGWYETLSEEPGHKVKRIRVDPGQQISLQKHHRRAEHWVVVRGTALVTLGELQLTLAAGQHIDIALGAVHRLANSASEPLEIIEVQLGAYLGEDDIVRLQDDYGRG
jgi:mannose-6-phosphate isomerase-like protein (cupin superfamily)